ncbi:MAG: hypothetical protein LUI05_00015 [Oscillospiraceae bacterium]|nr:hypothetical protein [Oscillospiraceae bacterium]
MSDKNIPDSSLDNDSEAEPEDGSKAVGSAADDKAHIKSNKKVSAIENLRQINERERREQILEESRKAELVAEKERAERSEYAKKLANDKIELIKLKQGVISEEDIPKETKEERTYSICEKIGNFFYHNKAYIIFVSAMAIIAGFLLYDLITNKKPDVAIMIIASDDSFDFYTTDIEKLLEPYCEDFNDDGVIYVRVSYLPASADTTDYYYTQTYQTKLIAEFQDETSIIVIADESSCEILNIEDGILADMREVYPDDENAAELGYMLSGTNFAEDIKYSAMADNLFIGFRVPTSGLGVNEDEFQTNYENALKLWDNYLNGVTVETDAVYYSEK